MLEYFMTGKLLVEQHLEFLSLNGSSTGSYESTLPHCWKSHVMAHLGLDATKPVFGVCVQHRRRPACASAQSDQRLCYSLFGRNHM